MTREIRLGLVLAVNLIMVLGLLAVGLLAHSPGVLAAGAAVTVRPLSSSASSRPAR